jgi:hypothetical protein
VSRVKTPKNHVELSLFERKGFEKVNSHSLEGLRIKRDLSLICVPLQKNVLKGAFPSRHHIHFL